MNDHSLSETHFPVVFQIALDLFRRPSPSGREDLVRAYAVEHLEHCGFAVSVDEAGNVLAVRGTPAPGESYPLLSFHMDCVSYETSLLTDRAGLFAASASGGSRVLSPIHDSRHRAQRDRAAELSLRPLDALEMTQGWLHSRGAFVLGGDDKCGGAIALSLAAMTTMPLKIVASVQEEIGCVGIDQVDPRFFKDVAYALVLDRRGANHLIVSIAGQLLCQGAFAAAMMRTAATTGLLVYASEGALSDARTLARHIPNVVNLSVGYYRPHTPQEQVALADLWRSYRWVYEALQRLPRSQSGHDLPSSQRAEAAASLVCPSCQKLTIRFADISEDLWRFVCQCPQATSSVVR
jgi:putative aminopeptidase FrvX